MVNEGSSLFIKVKYGSDIRKSPVNHNDISRFDNLENFARALFDIDNDVSTVLKYIDNGKLLTKLSQ